MAINPTGTVAYVTNLNVVSRTFRVPLSLLGQITVTATRPVVSILLVTC